MEPLTAACYRLVLNTIKASEVFLRAEAKDTEHTLVKEAAKLQAKVFTLFERYLHTIGLPPREEGEA